MNPFQFAALMRAVGARPNYKGLLLLASIVWAPTLFVVGIAAVHHARVSSAAVAVAIVAPK